MKSKITAIAFFGISILSGQEMFTASGGEHIPPAQNSVCLSDEKRQEILDGLELNRQQLIDQGLLQPLSAVQNMVHPLFQWPVVKNPDSPYNDVWSISNHVDHNAAFPNQIQDYNCGNRTYDTAQGYNHKGVDIFTWPFTWHQFQNNHSWVIAAAPGIIIGKNDGNYDMSCNFNNNNWNAVYVQHSDGSVSWYGHLKNGSLTTKNIGASVSAGEYLGVIGSSGNSTGPHLHFEVYNNTNQLVDTYSGTCNTWTSSSDSWWQSQKSYQDPKINAVLTHSAPPVFPTCPSVETPNMKDVFSTSEPVFAAIYLSDQLPGTSANLKLIRPDGTILYNYNHTLTDFYYSSYWYWSFSPVQLDQNGIWTFSCTYQGQTVSKPFQVGALDTAEFQLSDVTFYPNPASDLIVFSNDINKAEVFDMRGKKIEIPVWGREADISSLPKGVYILKGMDSDERKFILKLVK